MLQGDTGELLYGTEATVETRDMDDLNVSISLRREEREDDSWWDVN